MNIKFNINLFIKKNIKNNLYTLYFLYKNINIYIYKYLNPYILKKNLIEIVSILYKFFFFPNI